MGAERTARLAAFALVLLSATRASAYCRTTTCDVNDPDVTCRRDGNSCAIPDGKETFELYWPGGCSWWGVQKDGSAKRGISYEDAHAVIQRSLQRWLDADCGAGAHPAVALEDTDALFGPIDCREHAFNKAAANANAWLFRDDDWPYQGKDSTLALTTVTVSMRDGRMLDADVEINSFAVPLSTGSDPSAIDLEAVTTHEAGHFLGLAHVPAPTSTMFANYAGTDQRSLERDDVNGICAVYPPGSPSGCEQPSPLYGLSLECDGSDPVLDPAPRARSAASSNDGSCSVGPRRDAGGAPPLAVALGLAAAAVAQRRRPRRA